MRGNVLEFALVTFITTVIGAAYAMYVGFAVSARITELFNNLNETLQGVL